MGCVSQAEAALNERTELITPVVQETRPNSCLQHETLVEDLEQFHNPSTTPASD